MFTPTITADPDHFPTLVGYEGVSAYAAELGVPVSPRYIRTATEGLRPRLPSSKVARKVCYSRADVRSWLLSLRRPPSA